MGYKIVPALNDSAFVGIDYSMTSPAITRLYPEGTFQCCYLTTKKKALGGSAFFYGCLQQPFTCDEQRWDQISDWAMMLIRPGDIVFMEDYAFSAKGQITRIAELTAALKMKLYKRDIPYQKLSPSTIKKFAANHGKATKWMMYEAFVKETNINLEDLLKCDGTDNPITDIVDSYWIAKLGAKKHAEKARMGTV